MKNGMFRITRTGSDEAVCEVPVNRGYSKLARIYLTRGRVGRPDDEIVGNLAAFIAASEKGLLDIDIDPKGTDEERVARIMTEYEVELVANADEDDSSDSTAEVEENPTGTSEGNC